MAPKIAIVFYSMYGHIAKIAEAEKKGIEAAGGKVDLYQVKETLPQEVLTKMYAPGQNESIPFITPDKLEEYDAFLFGIPTRYGNFPAQWKTFWDQTGKQWQSGSYWGKYGGLFVSTASQGGGQESTAIAAMSTFAHHGIIYVPLGYKTAFQTLANLDEVRGGTPWGAGTFAGADGSRMPTSRELELAETHGRSFYQAVSREPVVAATTSTGAGGTTTTAAAANDATNGMTTTTSAKDSADGAKATAVGTKDSEHVNNSAKTPATQQITGEETKSGPCGLPSKCEIL